MTAPIVFTDKEQAALERIDGLSRAMTKVEIDIARSNRRILREKTQLDKLKARKASIQAKMRIAIDLIDTVKQRPEPL